jgi:hypothetical protein
MIVCSAVQLRQSESRAKRADFTYFDAVARRFAKPQYHLSNAAPGTPLVEFARVAKASHWIEECLKRSKSEAGLGEYQVRHWRGWHHHMALSLIATWFLMVEAHRGKKGGPGADGAAGADGPGADPAPGQPLRLAEPCDAGADAPAGAERVGAVLPLQGT